MPTPKRAAAAGAAATTRPARRRKPPLTVETLWALKRIAPPTLSPDGGTACAAVTSFDMADNESRTELWTFPTGFGAKGRPRALTAGDKDSDPQWSPDGTQIAFTAKRKGDDEPQVYLIDPVRRRGAAADPARDRLRVVALVPPTAGASRSSAGSGPTSPPTRCRRSGSRRARTTRSRRTSPSGASTGSGTTG